MTIHSLTKRPAFIALIGFATLGAGCTSGAIVDSNFNLITDTHPELTRDVPLTFIGIGSDLQPSGQSFTYWLQGESYVSFDSLAPDGATSSQFPGVKNVHQAIPEGNYYLFLDTSPTPPIPVYRSATFTHSYDGGCTDNLTGNSDQYCAQYLFQISDCTLEFPTFPTTAPQPLATHGGVKVIPLCRMI